MISVYGYKVKGQAPWRIHVQLPKAQGGETRTWVTKAVTREAAREEAVAWARANVKPPVVGPGYGKAAHAPRKVQASSPTATAHPDGVVSRPTPRALLPAVPDVDVRAAFARAFAPKETGPASGPVGPERPTPESVKPDAVIPPGSPEQPRGVKLTRLYEFLGRRFFQATEALTDAAVEALGRKPDDAEDDEEELITEGWGEQIRVWFGDTELGPMGKVGLGTLCMGIGKYVDGTKLPPKVDEKKPDEKPAATVTPIKPPEGGPGVA